MPSLLSSQKVALATFVAFSGTVILLATLRRHRPPEFAFDPALQTPHQYPHPCISSGGKRLKKKKKKVKFAEDVVDRVGGNEEFRRKKVRGLGRREERCSPPPPSELRSRRGEIARMPANRAALYSGILRDRGLHRLTYAY